MKKLQSEDFVNSRKRKGDTWGPESTQTPIRLIAIVIEYYKESLKTKE